MTYDIPSMLNSANNLQNNSMSISWPQIFLISFYAYLLYSFINRFISVTRLPAILVIINFRLDIIFPYGIILCNDLKRFTFSFQNYLSLLCHHVCSFLSLSLEVSVQFFFSFSCLKILLFSVSS